MCFFKFFFFLIYYLFRLHHVAWGILDPRPGIKLSSPAVEVQSLNPWTTREVPYVFHFKNLKH